MAEVGLRWCGVGRWLDELLADANANAESIAKRERCSIRKVNMTISLAFLAPDLVKAAIAGRLPHGIGVARLADTRCSDFLRRLVSDSVETTCREADLI